MSLKSGDYDYVPTDAADAFPHVIAVYEATKAHPLVAAEAPAAK